MFKKVIGLEAVSEKALAEKITKAISIGGSKKLDFVDVKYQVHLSNFHYALVIFKPREEVED